MGMEAGGPGFVSAPPRGVGGGGGYGGGSGGGDFGGGGPRITGPKPVAGPVYGGGAPIGAPTYAPTPTPDPKPTPEPIRLEGPNEVYTQSVQPTPMPSTPPIAARPQRQFVGGYTPPAGGGSPIGQPIGSSQPGRDIGSTPGPWRGPTGMGGNIRATGKYLPPPGTRPQPSSDVYRTKNWLR